MSLYTTCEVVMLTVPRERILVLNATQSAGVVLTYKSLFNSVECQNCVSLLPCYSLYKSGSILRCEQQYNINKKRGHKSNA